MRMFSFDRFREGVTLDTIRLFCKRKYRMFGGDGKLASFEKTVLVLQAHPAMENEARKLENPNFIVSGRFKAHAVRDGNLITGQQQSSGAAVARLVIGGLRV